MSTETVNKIVYNISQVYGVNISQVEPNIVYTVSLKMNVTKSQNSSETDVSENLKDIFNFFLDLSLNHVELYTYSSDDIRLQLTTHNFNETTTFVNEIQKSGFISQFNSKLNETSSGVMLNSIILNDTVDVVFLAFINGLDSYFYEGSESGLDIMGSEFGLIDISQESN